MANPAANFNSIGWYQHSNTPVFDGLNISSPRGGGGAFPLAAGHFLPAKMPLNAIYPRPDTETQSHARHRYMHTQMDYKIPIGVQGGAWPFKYEIIDAPAGTTIGETFGSSNYGVVVTPTASVPSSGVHTFQIRVTDQQLNIIILTWTSTVDDTKFTFIDNSYVGTSTGTFAQPLKSWSDWYLDDNADSTYLNQIIVLRQGSGNYVAQGDPGSNNNMTLDTVSKTPSLIGFPGEFPTVDCSACKINTNNLPDLTVIGIKFTQARQDVNNAHFFWCKNQVDRATFFGCEFDDFGKGLVGTDNNCPIFISARNGIKEHILLKGNTWNNIYNNDSSNGSYCDFYDVSNLLIEENICTNAASTYGFWCKGTTANVTVRGNIGIDNCDGRQITFGYGSESALLTHHHEACWNLFVIPFATNQDIILIAMSSANAGLSHDTFIYRNTFVGGNSKLRFPGVEDFMTDGNVIITDNLSTWDTGIQTTTVANVTGGTGSGIVDANGDLIGVSQTNYEGIAGYKAI